MSFTDGLLLPANHYFFVPQVEVTDDDGDFFWLSAPKPIVPPGTQFPPGFTDLQSWTRDAALDPDWLRVGTDITDQGPFNAAFSLNGADGSRAFDLGHDAARLRRPRFRGLSARQKGSRRQRMNQTKAAKAAFD